MPLTLITGPANAGKAQVVLDAVRAELAAGREPLLVVPDRAPTSSATLRELAGRRRPDRRARERFGGLIGEAVRRAGDARAGAARARARAAARDRRRRAAPRGARRATPLGRPLAGVRELIAELQVRPRHARPLQAALAKLDAGAGRAGDRRVEALTRRTRAPRGAWRVSPATRPSSGASACPTPSSAGCGRCERSAARALAVGRHAGAALRLRRSQPAAARRDRDARRRRGRAGDRVADLRAGPRGVRRAGRHLRGARAARPRAPRGSRPAPSTTRPRARAALGHLERSLFEPDAPQVSAGGAVRLLEGGGERAELELVARGDLEAAGGRVCAPAEIAVAVRGGGVSPELLEEVLARAGVPARAAAARCRSATARSAGR